jgi:hypothetical protein
MVDRTYSRRNFIKVAGLAAGALLLAAAQGAGNTVIAQTAALGKMYRGTRDGLVFESSDGGKTWQQVANFGSHCAVQVLSDRRGKLQARIGVGAHGFELASADGRKWYTT